MTLGKLTRRDDNEDIPTPSTPTTNKEVSIGSITWARAKLLNQQTNLFLTENSFDSCENWLLPKYFTFAQVYLG